jgi:SRSO17 transposase
LYVPAEWLTPEARQRVRIPATLKFQEKWRLALTLLRQIRAAGFDVTAVLGDAEFGDNATVRRTLHRLKLPYALGISSRVTVFRGTPRTAVPPKKPGRAGTPTRLQLTTGSHPEAVHVIAAALPARTWRRITWRNGENRPWAAHFAALRVTPAHDWRRQRRLVPDVWLLLERDLGSTPRIKAYLVDLPATASLRSLVRLAHHRWAIEQQYEELKDELGLDHFEGRSFVGWHRHVVLTAMAYAWLQDARRRDAARLPTLPVARAVITEILTAHFFVTRPHYLRTMQKLAEINLRI